MINLVKTAINNSELPREREREVELNVNIKFLGKNVVPTFMSPLVINDRARSAV